MKSKVKKRRRNESRNVTPAKRGLPPWLTPGNPGNSGGKKGRSGRRKNVWIAFCESAAVSVRHRRALKRILKNPAHPAFSSVSKFIAEQAFGKASQPMDVHAKVTLEDLVGGQDE